MLAVIGNRRAVDIKVMQDLSDALVETQKDLNVSVGIFPDDSDCVACTNGSVQ